MATRRSRSSKSGSGRDITTGRFAKRGANFTSIEDFVNLGCMGAVAFVVQRLNEEGEDFQEYAREWMQENRPWNDRTTDAREGLGALLTEKAPTDLVLTLYHTVEYGIPLELGHGSVQPYPVIGPGLEVLGPMLMERLEGIW